MNYKVLFIIVEVCLIITYNLSGLSEMKINSYLFLYRYLLLFILFLSKRKINIIVLFYTNVMCIIITLMLFFSSEGKIIGSECRYKNYNRLKTIKAGQTKQEVEKELGRPFYNHSTDTVFDSFYSLDEKCMYSVSYTKKDSLVISTQWISK